MAALATQDYSDNEIPGPFGPVPAKYNRSDAIQIPDDAKSKVGLEAMPSPRGELARMQVLLESIRLKQGRDVIDPSIIMKEQVATILELLKV